MREFDGTSLTSWLDAVEEVGVPELVAVAAGIRRDRMAIDAMLEVAWSNDNGQLEGQVNRLTMLKRHMNGRANFDLLRQRVLYAA